MQRDFARRLDEVEYRLGAHGIGEGFCDCVAGLIPEMIVRLMAKSGDSHDAALEAYEEIVRCKSDVHNPRPPRVRKPLTEKEIDTIYLVTLGGVESARALIDELAKPVLRDAVSQEISVSKPFSAKEPTLPERVAEQLATPPKKSLAEMLLLPEKEAAAGKRALQRAWGQDAPEPELPTRAVVAVIEPLDEEPFAEKVKRVAVYATHESMSDKLRGLLERTKA